jgi:glycosyltransferase involved in cell wall biosynthesis
MSSVDVIVPCYRYGRFLKECVQSVLAQSIPNLRVLILDDASPDNTAEISDELSRADSRVTVWRHTANKGHIATYNEGIDWASADYFVLLSADDYLLPGALSRAIEVMNDHPEVGFTYGKAFQLVDDSTSTQPVTIDFRTAKRDFRILVGLEFIELFERSGSINFVPTPTAVVRTALQKRLGGYRTELPHTGDMEMWLRLAAHSSVGVFDTYQAVWRCHGANMQLPYYLDNYQLRDLEQRKAALDCFFQNCGRVIPDAENLHRRLLRPLALQAIRKASHAFNDGKPMISEQLSEFALSAYPLAKRTLPWTLLSCKRLLGVSVARALLPAAGRIRQAAAKIVGAAKSRVLRADSTHGAS